MPSSDIHLGTSHPHEDFDAEQEDELWVCWGHKDYIKPLPSDIWITEDLAEAPTTMPVPPTLDEYDSVPKFSVLPKKYEKCIPSSVQTILKKFNVLHKFVDRLSFNSSENGERKSENPPLSGSSSVENVSNVGASTKISKPPISYDNLVVYRKKDDINVEKTGNERKSKKAAKQQRKMQKNFDQKINFALQEQQNNLNNDVSLVGSKKYTLHINQPAVSGVEACFPKNVPDINQDPPPIHAFVANLQKIQNNQTSANNLSLEFPSL